MKAQEFQTELQALMTRAFAARPIPLGQIILELELAKAKCVAIQLQVNMDLEARDAATKILPAGDLKFPNGSRIHFENGK